MRGLIIIVIIALGGVAGYQFIDAQVHGTDPATTEPNTVIKLKQEMGLMEGTYFANLQTMTQGDPIDYSEVLNRISLMEDSIKRIRSINKSTTLEKSLEKLASQVNHLNKYAQQQNPIMLRKKMDEVYQTCFRCHATHRVP